MSACLTDIPCWKKSPSTQTWQDRTASGFSKPITSLHFTIQLGSSTITPSRIAWSLGVVIDNQLNFSDHTCKSARSCRFALFNIKKIRPFLWNKLHSSLLKVGLLQCCLGRSSSQFYQTSTTFPKCSCKINLLKLKCKYFNILRYCFLTFISCKLMNQNKKNKTLLKSFTLHVMDLK